jgi:hypothetical protein
LDLIKDTLGGNIGYRKSQDTYYYNSTSFGSAKKVIKYLAHYHMLSSKYLNYLKWRKAYILVQAKKHLTPEGKDKIFKLKHSMNSYSKEILDTFFVFVFRNNVRYSPNKGVSSWVLILIDP